MKRVLVYIMLAIFIGGSASIILWEWNRGNVFDGSENVVAVLTWQESAEAQELQWDLARWYNLNLTSVRKDENFRDAYWDILDLKDHAMAVLSVPSLGLKIPIYHGTDGPNGAGHIQTTAFPLGQAGEHCAMTVPVLLEEGTYFYIHILHNVLAYQVTDREYTAGEELTFDAKPDETLCTLVWGEGIGQTLLHGAYAPGAPAEGTIQVEAQDQEDGWLTATCLVLILGILLVPCLAMTGKG